MIHRYLDRNGAELHDGDFVRASGIGDELFRIKSLRYPAEAIIENLIPGGRLGTSTMPTRSLDLMVCTPTDNPPAKPGWFDDTYEQPDLSPIRGTLLPCGCHLRRVDGEAVLCVTHLLKVNAR